MIETTKKLEIHIPAGEQTLIGNLSVPENAGGLILFAHGSGSSRHSTRNKFVAEAMNQRGLATLLLDLLTPQEEQLDRANRHLRFDIPFLRMRLVHAIDWAKEHPRTQDLALGLFGASTGAAAALMAAAERPSLVQAVVSRGGRPDLAGACLPRVQAPTLLVVGGEDKEVVALNREALQLLKCPTKLELIPGATHLFEEPGTLETVATLASNWFAQQFS